MCLERHFFMLYFITPKCLALHIEEWNKNALRLATSEEDSNMTGHNTAHEGMPSYIVQGRAMQGLLNVAFYMN
jgi:hypothetical protein